MALIAMLAVVPRYMAISRGKGPVDSTTVHTLDRS